MELSDIANIAGAKIMVRVEENTRQGKYCDAIFYTPEEWAKLSTGDVEKESQDRAEAWASFVETQSSKPPVVPTKAELEEILAVKEKEVADLKLQIAAATAVEP